MSNQVPLVLLYDLEIAPLLGWAYEVYEANIIKVERQPYVMCFAWQWLGDERIQVCAQPDFPDWYAKEPYDDHFVALQLHRLLDAADCVVAHNASRFDNKVAAARFLDHGMAPPSPYRTIDTLTAARKYFRLGNNSLDKVCQRLGIGEKAEKRHHDLWPKCIDGDLDSWELMKEYCKRDVELLAGLYARLAPFITTHPNMGTMADGTGCPRCGAKRLQSRGHSYTQVGSYRRYQCIECGGWCRERLADKEHERPELVPA